MLGGGDQILEISIEYEHIFMHLGYFNMNGFILEGVYIRNPLPNMPMFM